MIPGSSVPDGLTGRCSAAVELGPAVLAEIAAALTLDDVLLTQLNARRRTSVLEPYIPSCIIDDAECELSSEETFGTI